MTIPSAALDSGGRRAFSGALRRHRGLVAGPVASIAFGLMIVVLIGATSTSGEFLTSANATAIGAYIAVPVIIAAFSSVALLAGAVDLSIGSMTGLGAVVFATLVNDHRSPWFAAAVVLVVAAAVGVVNGLAIVVFNAEPLAATLGMLTVLAGLSLVIDGGKPVPAFLGGFFAFTNRNAGPAPLIFLLAVAGVAVITLVLTRTRWGQHVKATGGDERAARRAGIPAGRIKFAALILSALGAAVGGMVYVGQQGAASSALGVNLEFQVYAALMIGGFSILRGGIGNPVGGLLGVLVVAGVQNILDLRSSNIAYANLITGVVLILAVLLDRARGGEAFH